MPTNCSLVVYSNGQQKNREIFCVLQNIYLITFSLDFTWYYRGNCICYGSNVVSDKNQLLHDILDSSEEKQSYKLTEN